MQEMIDAVSALYRNWSGKDPVQVDVLPQSGSDRRYFRLFDEANQTVIATLGPNVAENETFVYFTGHFSSKGLPVPTIWPSMKTRPSTCKMTWATYHS
jgi:hypothetical protein